MSKQNVLTVLKDGNWIRMSDGRYQYGFVNVQDVLELVENGEAELFKNKGVEMARIKNTMDAKQ